MSDVREALAALLFRQGVAWRQGVADAILAEFDVTERGEEWEYGVRCGEDGTVKNYGSRDRAEGSASEFYGDKIARRRKARLIPAGEWEEVPR